MAGRGMASIATLLIPITLVRVVDQAEFGTYKQLFLIFTTLYSVALIGLSDSLYYFIPKQPAEAGRYVANAVLGLLVAGLACLGLLAVARRPIAAWMRNDSLSEHLVSIGVFLLFTLAATVLEIALIARKRYSWASSAYVVSDVLRALCFVLPMFVWPSLRVLLLWCIAFAFVRFLAAIVLLRREFGAALRPDASLLPAQLSYAMPFALYVLVELLQATWPQYAVSRAFDAATFAIFSVACFQVPFVDFLATPASSVMMVRMTEEMRDERPRQALAIWLDITRKLALVFFPMVALLMVTSFDIIAFLFTDAYARSAPIFALWVATIALAVVQTDGVMRVHAQIRFLFAVNVLRLILIVALIQPSIDAFGLAGPVLLTLGAMTIAKGLHLVRMKQVMRLRVGELLPWGSLAAIVAASVLSAPPAMVASDAVAGPRILKLLVAACAFGLSYLSLLFGSGLIRPEERASLAHLLRLHHLRPLASSDAR
jgi:O-antigen/teichoic acid export membrane protein